MNKKILLCFSSLNTTFLSTDVKFTHPSNEVSQDNIVVFQDPLVLKGVKNKQWDTQSSAVLNCETSKAGEERKEERI